MSANIPSMASKSSSVTLLMPDKLNVLSVRQNEAFLSQSFETLQDHTGYSSDETDRGYDRPGSGATAQSSSLAPRRAENGSMTNKSAGGDASRLVNQICTPGGLRAQPSREDLRIFVESLGSQSGQEIAELLEDKLVSCLPSLLVQTLTCTET